MGPAGAQGAHKVARGYLPEATYSAHWIADERFRDAVARFVDDERRYVMWASAKQISFRSRVPDGELVVEADPRRIQQVLNNLISNAIKYSSQGGQIVDASIVPVPIQRNGRDENAEIKAGKTPEDWQNKPAKLAQKDVDARWTKKRGRSYFGYKNHINVDRTHKLIRRYAVTDASVHDSQVLDDVLDSANTSSDVWADSAYRSKETESKLADKGLKSRIHRKASRARPLTEREKRGNKTRSRVRSRVEHIFGDQQNAMGGNLVRTIGLARAKTKIGLKNLAYNMRRMVQLQSLDMAAAP